MRLTIKTATKRKCGFRDGKTTLKESTTNIAVSSTSAVTGLTTLTERVKIGDVFISTGPTLAKTGAISMDNNLQVATVVEDSMEGDTVEENTRQRKTRQRRFQKRQKDTRPKWGYRPVAKKAKQRSQTRKRGKKDVRPKLGCRTVAKKRNLRNPTAPSRGPHMGRIVSIPCCDCCYWRPRGKEASCTGPRVPHQELIER